MKIFIVTVIFIIYTLNDLVLATDYCKVGLCKNNVKHIGCGSTDDFGPNCPSERSFITITAKLKAYLLQKHNEARNSIALGNISGYSPANRMIQMTWDDELAKLAEYNVKTCIFNTDKCHNTDIFKYAGQNIAIVRSTPNYFDAIGAIDYLFDLWFDQYKVCDMSYINKYRSSYNVQIGSFTQIVSAGANKVGCALRSFADSRKNVYLVCNYSLGNLLDLPVYLTGAPCSACIKGCSSAYLGLCKSTEVIPLS